MDFGVPPPPLLVAAMRSVVDSGGLRTVSTGPLLLGFVLFLLQLVKELLLLCYTAAGRYRFEVNLRVLPGAFDKLALIVPFLAGLFPGCIVTVTDCIICLLFGSSACCLLANALRIAALNASPQLRASFIAHAERLEAYGGMLSRPHCDPRCGRWGTVYKLMISVIDAAGVPMVYNFYIRDILVATCTLSPGFALIAREDMLGCSPITLPDGSVVHIEHEAPPSAPWIIRLFVQIKFVVWRRS